MAKNKKTKRKGSQTKPKAVAKTTTKNPVMPKDRAFFHLVVGDGNNIKVDNASVPVRWCVNEYFMKNLRNKAERDSKLGEPHVILTVVHPERDDSGQPIGKKELSRVVVPLADSMAYIDIHRPGEAEIHATVVFFPKKMRMGLYGKLIKGMLARNNNTGQLKEELCTEYSYVNQGYWDGSIKRLDDDIAYHLTQYELPDGSVDMVDINTPAELFSKPLPGWFESFINFGYESKLEDDCHIRRRAMLAIFFQSWAVPIWATMIIFVRLLIASYWTFMGVRPQWGNVVKPFAMDMSSVSYNCSLRDSYFLQNAWSAVFWPPFLLLGGIVFYVLFSMFGTAYFDFQWALTMLASGALMVIAGGTVAIAWHKYVGSKGIGAKVFRMTGLPALGRFLDRSFDKFIKWWAEREERLWNKAWDDNTQALSCQGRPLDMVADINKLHRSKKSVHLRFKDLKSKVCKPRAL